MRNMMPIAVLIMSVTGSAHGTPLTQELWRTRPLIVAAPGHNDAIVAELQRALAQKATLSAFADRQIVVFTVIGGEGARAGQALQRQATASLLAGLGLRADGPAAVLLVGKDGGVKLRLTHVAVAEILAAVDQMPMRRQEVGGR
jgi:hypothetical protein